MDELDILLTSAEFYSLDEESWQEVGNLQHGRTEHGISKDLGILEKEGANQSLFLLFRHGIHQRHGDGHGWRR